MTDRSGRSFASDRAGRRSGVKPAADPIRQDMQDFAREMIGQLDSHRRAQDFSRLIILATPAMLGILREEMPPALRQRIVFERATNVIQLPESDLRRLIRKMLKVGEEQ